MVYSYNRSQRDALFLKFISIKNCTCFGQICCPSSGVSTLYSQQLVFVILVLLASASEFRTDATRWLLLQEYVTMHGPLNVIL